MALTAAPFHADVAEGPGSGAAYWLTTTDGVRVRVAYWPLKDARGTLFLFPGRTEYVEKYGMMAAEMARRGYAMMAIDWRGQGIADRLLPDRRVGHVGKFHDYQHDVAAFLDAAEVLNVPKPFHVLGHSMGGAIGLRAVMDGLPVKSCAFTGPMWGIRIAGLLRPIAWGLYYASGWANQGHRLPPTTRYENYVMAEEFEGNMLTTDPEMYALMRRQITAYPDLALGGPSVTWVGEALRECQILGKRPAPGIPALTIAGSGEIIVDVDKMRDRMNAWPDGRFHLLEDANHEVLMETPEKRGEVFDMLEDLFVSAESDRSRAQSA
ncbi:alpha/beta hydrolase [Thalassococcus sp. S3]|uniref:alpha/beta hydrolase n=1 Tax=Thalassococcus sp. S3 TaxID=2017482 RepID=UPI00158238BD|nr:alpha/beta hydrolase [Thalassococcus sp. S3]